MKCILSPIERRTSITTVLEYFGEYSDQNLLTELSLYACLAVHLRVLDTLWYYTLATISRYYNETALQREVDISSSNCV